MTHIVACSFYLSSLHTFSSPQSFAAFVASKQDDSQEEGSTSWSCCGQTFKEHPDIHKHVARTHDAEIKQLTWATYECPLSQLEEEPETQHRDEAADISAWIPDISHISEEQLQKYWSTFDSPFWVQLSLYPSMSLYCFKVKIQLKCKTLTDASWCSLVFRQGSRQGHPLLSLLSGGGSTCHLCLAESFVWKAPLNRQGEQILLSCLQIGEYRMFTSGTERHFGKKEGSVPLKCIMFIFRWGWRLKASMGQLEGPTQRLKFTSTQCVHILSSRWIGRILRSDSYENLTVDDKVYSADMSFVMSCLPEYENCI